MKLLREPSHTALLLMQLTSPKSWRRLTGPWVSKSVRGQMEWCSISHFHHQPFHLHLYASHTSAVPAEETDRTMRTAERRSIQTVTVGARLSATSDQSRFGATKDSTLTIGNYNCEGVFYRRFPTFVPLLTNAICYFFL